MQEYSQNPRPAPPNPGSGPPRPPQARSALTAVDVAIGIADGAVGFARSAARLGGPMLGSVMSPLASAARTAVPYADRIGQAWAQPRLTEAAARGRHDRETVTSAVIRLALARVPGLANALLDQLDLTAVVAERVDLAAVLDHLDPDAVTRYLVEELDLPVIIQSSTGSVMSDTVHDVRMLSITADERLSKAVDAMLLRRRSRRTAAPGGATSTGAHGLAYEQPD